MNKNIENNEKSEDNEQIENNKIKLHEKIKNIVMVMIFVAIIGAIFLASVLTPSIEISMSERRHLAQWPDFNWERALGGDFFDDFEDYIKDQFFQRDFFRAISALAKFNLFRLNDNNGIFVIDGAVYSMDFPLNENNIVRAANRFNRVYERYFADGDFNVFYSVIPDKNYFVRERRDTLTYDYNRLLELMHENVSDSIRYIDIFDTLTIEDYYRTDLHWRQDKLSPVVERLLNAKGRVYTRPTHTHNTMYPFRGSYFGQAAIPLRPDTLSFMTNETINNARAFIHSVTAAHGQRRLEIPIYDVDAFYGVDPFNLFLGGPQMIVEIENPTNPDGGELIIFRDSFGSSLAPMLIEHYSRIILIDMRYIRYDLYERFVSFTPGSDVLFMLNTQILNHSVMLQ